MDVSFNSSVSGLRAAVARVDNVANNVANVNTEGFQPQRVVQSEGAARDSVSLSVVGQHAQDLAQDMTELMSSARSYDANLRVISMKNNMIGETINLIR